MAVPINTLKDAEQRILALEKQLADIKKQALPLLAHQRGPLPGYMRAVAFNDPALKGSMWTNFSNIGPGQGPYSAVTDPSGVIRTEWGNLAANGLSPAQLGFRSNDASGSPFFDTTIGFFQVLSVPISNFVSASFTTSSTTPVLITSSGASFTPTHQVRVVALYGGSVSYTGQTAFIDLFLDSSNKSAGGNGPALQLQFPTTTSGAVTSTGFYTTTLTANVSHTFDLRASQNGVTSLTVLQCAIVVLVVGVN